jgi:hypothetical protein
MPDFMRELRTLTAQSGKMPKVCFLICLRTIEAVQMQWAQIGLHEQFRAPRDKLSADPAWLTEKWKRFQGNLNNCFRLSIKFYPLP